MPTEEGGGRKMLFLLHTPGRTLRHTAHIALTSRLMLIVNAFVTNRLVKGAGSQRGTRGATLTAMEIQNHQNARE